MKGTRRYSVRGVRRGENLLLEVRSDASGHTIAVFDPHSPETRVIVLTGIDAAMMDEMSEVFTGAALEVFDG